MHPCLAVLITQEGPVTSIVKTLDIVERLLQCELSDILALVQQIPDCSIDF